MKDKTLSKPVASRSNASFRELAQSQAWSYVGKLDPKEQIKFELQVRADFAGAIYCVDDDLDDNRYRLLNAFDRIRDMNPQSAIEFILAQQIEITREMAMKCAKQVNSDHKSESHAELCLSRYEKLLNQLIKLISAFNKQKGKTSQKVRVEHVHVNEGGQAFVGHLETTAVAEPKPI